MASAKFKRVRSPGEQARTESPPRVRRPCRRATTDSTTGHNPVIRRARIHCIISMPGSWPLSPFPPGRAIDPDRAVAPQSDPYPGRLRVQIRGRRAPTEATGPQRAVRRLVPSIAHNELVDVRVPRQRSVGRTDPPQVAARRAGVGAYCVEGGKGEKKRGKTKNKQQQIQTQQSTPTHTTGNRSSQSGGNGIGNEATRSRVSECTLAGHGRPRAALGDPVPVAGQHEAGSGSL